MLGLFAFIILGVQAFVIARLRETILNYVKKQEQKGRRLTII
jgi:hypothetical protein